MLGRPTIQVATKLSDEIIKSAERPEIPVATKVATSSPPDHLRTGRFLSLGRSESADHFVARDGLSVSIESLSLSSGSLVNSCGSLANSHGSLANSLGSLANSRGSLAINHAILSNSRATVATTVFPCDASFLGSSTFLADCSFSLDINEQIDGSVVEQNPAEFFVGSVNSVWSRDEPADPSPAHKNDGDLTSKDAASDESVPDANCATMQSKPVSAEDLQPIETVLPLKRLLSEGEELISGTDAVVSPKRASPKRQLSKWTKQEDQRLEAGIKLYGIPNWVMVATHVKTRNNKMCAQRWRNCLRPETKAAKKGKWSEAEDEQLRQIVRKYGCGDGSLWEKASEDMGFTRNSKQCRERWTNFLDPTLRLGPWTEDEDAYLLHLHNEFGNAWKKFASILTGRSAERIRRRYSMLNENKK